MSEARIISETESLKNILTLIDDPILSNPIRFSIMITLLLRRIVTFSELQKILGISPSTLESHIDKLIKSGFVEKRKTLYNLSVRVVIKPTPQGIEKTINYIRRLRGFLEKIVSEVESKVNQEFSR